MIDESYINNLKPPNCIICDKPMMPDHTKYWTGQRSVYLAIRFVCSGGQSHPEIGHRLELKAGSIEQWERWQLAMDLFHRKH